MLVVPVVSGLYFLLCTRDQMHFGLSNFPHLLSAKCYIACNAYHVLWQRGSLCCWNTIAMLEGFPYLHQRCGWGNLVCFFFFRWTKRLSSLGCFTRLFWCPRQISRMDFISIYVHRILCLKAWSAEPACTCCFIYMIFEGRPLFSEMLDKFIKKFQEAKTLHNNVSSLPLGFIFKTKS